MTATIDLANAKDHLGDCDINMESELPEIRLYKAGTGICLESPDKHFSVIPKIGSCILSTIDQLGR